ncbi:inositol monophosphatase family protein [Streptomyces sp. NPDC004393]|uniref:inositol monophosphatase family protein n=1 Tax=Streptomyces sp. NPDC004533 TaxID=3154278 RepID=UPI0033AFAFBA
MTEAADTALAHHLADLADAVARRRLAAPDLTVRTKNDGSPVTDVDQEIEHVLRSEIRRHRPGDAFVGEESGASGTGRRRWIVDGIDGTASFLAGEPEWSTLIAVGEDGGIVLGMVSAPALRRRWWAAPGAGAWAGPCPSRSPMSARRLSIAEGGRPPHDVTLGIWPPPARLSASERSVAARLAAHVARTRPALDWSSAAPATPPPRKPSTGSGTCHGALLVATGQVDAFLLLGAGPWDIAALIPVVEEAGGVFSDLEGRRRADTGAALFALPGLHRPLLDIAGSDG